MNLFTGELLFDSSDGRVMYEVQRQCPSKPNKSHAMSLTVPESFVCLFVLGTHRDTNIHYVVGNLSSRRRKKKKRNVIILME
jgi:hypothetical protein